MLNSHPAHLNQVLDTPDVQVQEPWSWSRNAAGCEFNQKRCEFNFFLNLVTFLDYINSIFRDLLLKKSLKL